MMSKTPPRALGTLQQWPQDGSTHPAELDSWAEGGWCVLRRGGEPPTPSHQDRLPRLLSVSVGPQLPFTSAPATLTEESPAVETDGGLAGHLGSVEDGIIELVREGQSLWTRWAVQGKVGMSPGHLSPRKPG